jgi:hypothetical protein
VLPRVVLRVRRTVRRWTRPEESSVSGPEIDASWQRMMDRLRPPPTETERRMAEIERELNRLGLD